MNKEKVLSTAFSFFRDGQWEARSPMLPYEVARGESQKEAEQNFERLIDDWSSEHGGEGPEPPRQDFAFDVRPQTFAMLHRFTEEYGCTLDEALDVLVARYYYLERSSTPLTDFDRPLSSHKSMTKLLKQIR